MTLEEAAHWGEILTGIATVALVGAAVFLFLEAKRQLEGFKIQEENATRRAIVWETLRACSQYDTDPIIEVATKRIWDASGPTQDYAKADRRDIIIVMNYL